jgi:thiamine phosphate synthase YjbQ (UPF0047 family)
MIVLLKHLSTLGGIKEISSTLQKGLVEAVEGIGKANRSRIHTDIDTATVEAHVKKELVRKNLEKAN